MKLATSGSIDGIQKLINQFWCSQSYWVNPETLTIEHPTKSVTAQVVKVGKRYEFHG